MFTMEAPQELRQPSFPPDVVASLRVLDLEAVPVSCDVGGDVTESTLAAWARDNADLDDRDAHVAALLRGQRVEGGGGATPRWSAVVP